MLKLGLKLLDRKKESKYNSQTKSELPTALPAFEWQITSDSSLGSLITHEKDSEAFSLPDDAIFGTTNERKIFIKRTPTLSHGRTSNAESSRLRLIQIIENEDARNNFQNYLKSQYCEENLDFYMDVVQYRELFCSSAIHINEDVREISSTAKFIWNYYLDSDTSSKPLNVPQDLANQCRQKIDSKTFTNDIFDKLQQHCFDLMVQDSLPKFLRKSTIMHENFSALNSPTIPSHLKPPFPAQKPLFGPRKSRSSGSLRARMASTLATLKTAVSEVNLSSGISVNTTTTNNITPACNRNTISAPIPNSKCQTSQIVMTQETRSNSNVNNNIISAKVMLPESNRSSTVSTDSESSSPSTNSSISTNSTTSRLSLSNITRRVLTRRRNSINLILAPKIVEMPGSYPCAPVVGCDKYDECNELEGLSRDQPSWQKLRRNTSTSNFQSGSRLRRTINNQMYNNDKSLPTIPAAN